MYKIDIARYIYICYTVSVFLDSSMVEHSAVNRVVAGSSPARGVKHLVREILLGAYIWPVGQAVKTSPFHGGNTSSILVGVTKRKKTSILCLSSFFVSYEKKRTRRVRNE